MDKKQKKQAKEMCLQAYQSGVWHEADIEYAKEMEYVRSQKLSKAYLKYGNAKLIKNLFRNQMARICCRENATRYLEYVEFKNAHNWKQRYAMRMTGVMEFKEEK